MALRKINSGQLVFLIIMFGVLALMSWFDVQTSGQAGQDSANRGITHIFIALAVILHGIYFIFRRVRNQSSRVIVVLLYIILLWYIIVDILNGKNIVGNAPNYIMAIWWIVSIGFTYSFCRRNPRGVGILSLLYCGMFLFWVFLNIKARTSIITNFDRANAVTGFSYFLIVLLPFIYLLKDSWFKKFLLVLDFIMVVTSFKRGAMITMPVMLLVYYYSKNKINGKRGLVILYFVAFSIIAYFTLSFVNERSGGYLTDRFSQEELASGSGRDEIRKLAIQSISQRNIGELVIGVGHGGSEQLVGTGLHNEWLEFLYNFGIIGVMLYFILGIGLLRMGIKAFRERSQYAPHILMMVAYFYMVGIFSGFYGVYTSYYFFAFIGIISSLYEESLKQGCSTCRRSC